MANRCENVLRVSGNYNGLSKFDAQFRGNKYNSDEDYHFDNLYPTPRELVYSGAADWRREHWGVKGSFYEDSFACDKLCEGETEIYYYFETQWVGPKKLIEHISKEYKNLEFMLVCSEPGNGISDLCIYSGGYLVSEERLSEDDIKYWFGDDEETERGVKNG